MCPSRNSIASYWNYFQTFSLYVLAEKRMRCTEIIPRHFKTVSRPKINCIVPKLFQNIFKQSPRPNSIAMYQNYCETFPKCVLLETELHLIEIILRHFQIFSRPKFSWILLKLFWDVFELSPSPNSIAWYQNCCKAFP